METVKRMISRVHWDQGHLKFCIILINSIIILKMVENKKFK